LSRGSGSLAGCSRCVGCACARRGGCVGDAFARGLTGCDDAGVDLVYRVGDRLACLRVALFEGVGGVMRGARALNSADDACYETQGFTSCYTEVAGKSTGRRKLLTDQQLMTLALAVIIPLSLLIYSNSRVSDVGKRVDDLSKRVDDLDKKLSSRFDNFEKHLEEKIDNAFAHMELLLKLHEAEHHQK
jgi:hypothetical protein